MIAILLLGLGAGLSFTNRQNATLGSTEVASPANPSAAASSSLASFECVCSSVLLLLGGLVGLAAAVYFLFRGYTWLQIKSERSFDMLIVTGTLVLPMLSAFPIKFLQASLKVQIPTTAAEVQALTAHDVLVVGVMVAAAFLLSIVIGMISIRDWWKYALTFWVPFTVFYTTVFTNTDGFFTGIVGSLGYWLVQQGVQRGSQPWYYYILILLPVYELPTSRGSISICYCTTPKTT